MNADQAKAAALKLLSDKDMDEIQAAAVQLVRNLTKGLSDDLPFQIILFSVPRKGGDTIVHHFSLDLSQIPDNASERAQLLEQLGFFTAIKFKVLPVAVQMLFMAWMVKAEEGSLPPSENPDAQEVIVISLTSMDNRSRTTFMPLERDEAGQIHIDESALIHADDIESQLNQSFFQGISKGVVLLEHEQNPANLKRMLKAFKVELEKEGRNYAGFNVAMSLPIWKREEE